MSLAAGSKYGTFEKLTQLIDELLDAHCDTVCLASEVAGGEDWDAHVDYLRRLQRVGQRMLAQLSAERLS